MTAFWSVVPAVLKFAGSSVMLGITLAQEIILDEGGPSAYTTQLHRFWDPHESRWMLLWPTDADATAEADFYHDSLLGPTLDHEDMLNVMLVDIEHDRAQRIVACGGYRPVPAREVASPSRKHGRHPEHDEPAHSLAASSRRFVSSPTLVVVQNSAGRRELAPLN